jgi:hypothetical protein
MIATLKTSTRILSTSPKATTFTRGTHLQKLMKGLQEVVYSVLIGLTLIELVAQEDSQMKS